MQQRSSEWIERLARFGFAAKGFVYVVIGLLAAQAALSGSAHNADQQGAFQAIVTQPFGKILLALVGIGLIGYALWRFVEAALDPEGNGKSIKGLFKRIGYGINGLVYAGIALSAISIAIGSGKGSNSDTSAQDGTARLLSQPFGQWLVGLVGLLVIALGFYFFQRAYKANFLKELELHRMNETEQTWATRIGRVGHTARGIVFTLIGLFLLQAARRSDPNQARGLAGALNSLSQQSYGPIVLGVVALGLIAYGAYMAVEAKYRRIYPPQVDISQVNAALKH